MFQPGDLFRTAIDPVTNSTITVRGRGSSMRFKQVTFSGRGIESLNFTVELQPQEKPNAIISTAQIQREFLSLGLFDTEFNTDLLRYMLNGLSVIDSRWPFFTKWSIVGTDFSKQVSAGRTLLFNDPGEVTSAQPSAL